MVNSYVTRGYSSSCFGTSNNIPSFDHTLEAPLLRKAAEYTPPSSASCVLVIFYDFWHREHEKEVKELEKKDIIEYEVPEVVTYSEDDILEELGPAQACSPSPCPTP